MKSSHPPASDESPSSEKKSAGAELTFGTFGLPHIAANPDRPANKSNLEPDAKAIGIDDSVQADMEAAKANDPSIRKDA